LLIKRIRHTITKAPAIRPALAWLYHSGLNPSDVFVASYPRAGSTWLRFLLYELLTGQTTSFEAVNKGIPNIGRHYTAPQLLDSGARLIQTHEPYRPEYGRAIYLVRDVRDVVISEYYFQQLWQLFDGTFDQFLQAFLAGKANRYGSWVKHTTSWLDALEAARGQIIFLRFDELRQNTAATLADILAFLGAEVGGSSIEKALANNTAVEMRKKESSLKLPSSNLNFVRKGKVGGWQEFLTLEQIQQIDRQTGAILNKLGYSITLTGSPQTPRGTPLT
jgi:hypothetical protein